MSLIHRNPINNDGPVVIDNPHAIIAAAENQHRPLRNLYSVCVDFSAAGCSITRMSLVLAVMMWCALACLAVAGLWVLGIYLVSLHARYFDWPCLRS